MSQLSIKLNNGIVIPAISVEDSFMEMNSVKYRRISIEIQDIPEDVDSPVDYLMDIFTSETIDPLVISQGDKSTKISGFNTIDAISKRFFGDESKNNDVIAVILSRNTITDIEEPDITE